MRRLGCVMLAIVAGVLLGGCYTLPLAPSVRVLPAPGKPFEVFQADDAACRQWAAQQTGGTPSEAANESLGRGAAIGTLAGAGLGAIIGSVSGSAGVGAAIGAGTGLLGGMAVASQPAYATGYEIQRRYDMAYEQCMYAKGNQIGGATAAPWPQPVNTHPPRLVPAPAPSIPPPPPPGAAAPPPPSAGAPPPPPPPPAPPAQ